jgi:hypothetical protein
MRKNSRRRNFGVFQKRAFFAIFEGGKVRIGVFLQKISFPVGFGPQRKIGQKRGSF